jgi:hypothetical protein
MVSVYMTEFYKHEVTIMVQAIQTRVSTHYIWRGVYTHPKHGRLIVFWSSTSPSFDDAKTCLCYNPTLTLEFEVMGKDIEDKNIVSAEVIENES